MYSIVEAFIKKMNVSDITSFGKKNNIILNDDETRFVYDFIKANWNKIIKNPNSLNIDRYKDRFSTENFPKVKLLIEKYALMFKNII